jgi:uncharacterized protein (UPF0332 family)
MLKKAEGSFQSAKNDIENHINDRAVSSLYYSAFQTVTAYMLHMEIRSKSHTQVRSFVNNKLIRPKLLSIELGKMYNKLMDMRSDADYSDVVTFTDEQVEGLLEKVKEFNQAVRSLIK